MSRRKELHEDCDGSVFCRVEGHVRQIERGAFIRHSHIELTAGQRRTLYERRVARRGEQEQSA